MDERVIYDGFDRVWRILERNSQEIRESSRETDRKIREMSQETDRKIREMSQETLREIRAMSQETDRKFQETNQKFLETNQKFQEAVQEIRAMSRETDKRINKVSQDIGRLGGRWGEFIEEMVRPAVIRLFQQHGLPVHEVHRHVNSKRNGMSAEIDLLVVNDEVSIAVEVKSLLSVDDVREHQERLKKFKLLFPRYADTQLMGAVAGAVVTEEVAKYAYRQGFFVLGQKGENMEILNDESFEPKIY